MAAAMVSGGAALLLQATPNLTARNVKVALQVTAEFMPEAGLVAAGAGSVNLYSARKVSSGNDGLLGVLSSLLIGGRPVTGSGFAFLRPGARLDQSRGEPVRVYGLIDARKPGWPSRLSPTTPSQIVWGDMNMWTADQQIVWGDYIFNPASQQIVWGDQVYNPSGQQIVWGDQVYNPSGQQIVWGDADYSNANQIVWGDSIPPGQ
jgi:hypothetical protein